MAILACWLLSIGQDALSDVIRDDLGRAVPTTPQPMRIVTLAPHATELVLAAGLRDRLVAVASGSAPEPELANLARIGGPGLLDREALMALQPDLVVAWDSGNRPADLAWIETSGIRLFRSEPQTLADIARSIRVLGLLGDRPDSAAAAAAAFRSAVRTPCAALPRQPAYVQIWRQPRLSVGGQHWLNSVLHAAGYRNVFESVPIGVFAISPEAELAEGGAARIGLERRYDGSADDELADLLSRPGPQLAKAVTLLCQRRWYTPANAGSP